MSIIDSHVYIVCQKTQGYWGLQDQKVFETWVRVQLFIN